MTTYCEHCGAPHDDGQTLVSYRGLTIEGLVLSFGEQEVWLAPAMARFCRTLLLKGKASIPLLTNAIESKGDKQTNIVRVYATHLRRHLVAMDVPLEVNSLSKWGYELRSVKRSAH